MAGKQKLTPIEVFEENIADAQRLLDLASLVQDQRVRWMREELRAAIGTASRLPQKKWGGLDRVESNDLLIILKPDGRATREDFTEISLRPLLRQAVVAIAAAVESYVAEKACTFIGEALRCAEPPRRLLDITVSFEDMLWVEEYQRRGWAHRYLVEQHLKNESSADPAKIGMVLDSWKASLLAAGGLTPGGREGPVRKGAQRSRGASESHCAYG